MYKESEENALEILLDAKRDEQRSGHRSVAWWAMHYAECPDHKCTIYTRRHISDYLTYIWHEGADISDREQAFVIPLTSIRDNTEFEVGRDLGMYLRGWHLEPEKALEHAVTGDFDEGLERMRLRPV